MNILQTFKPAVPKRYLLLVAGMVWTIAGCILFLRGTFYLVGNANYLGLRFLIGIVGGLIFYYFMFSRISLKYITRIKSIDIVRPCLFSFFNFKSYVLMIVMITGGILLRKFDVINHNLLYNFYLLMGTPLLLSAARFYYAWWKYKLFVTNDKR